MVATYRQLSHRLRIQRGPGRPDKVLERPREGSRERGWGRYLDSDEKPTLITFDEYDQVDIAQLLRSGAIVPWEEVTTDGEIREHRDTDISRSI